MKGSACLFASVIGLLLLFHSSSALAIYTWTDEQGIFHMSDFPPAKGPAAATPPDAEETGSREQAQPAVPAAPPEPIVKTAPTAAPEPVVKTAPQSAGSITPQPSVVAAPVSAPVKSGQTGTLIMIQQRSSVSSTSTATAVVASAVTATPRTVEPAAVPQNIPLQIPQTKEEQQNAVLALVKKIMSVVIIFLIAGYLYVSLCLFLIARKLNVSAAWIAFVPLFQILILCYSANKPGWWMLLFFVPLVNIVIPIYLWMCISENLGKDKWLGLLMLVPLVNLVYLGMLAFSSQGAGRSAQA